MTPRREKKSERVLCEGPEQHRPTEYSAHTLFAIAEADDKKIQC
jgi:hypothetical protein